MSGKGSSPRPFSVSADTFASNFDAIFGKKLVYQGVEVVDVAPLSEAKAADYLIFRKDAGAKDGPTIDGAKASASSITEADRNGGQGAAQDWRAAEGND